MGVCSKDDEKIYQQWFNYADSDGDGRITGDDATKFFVLSNLDKSQLKQVFLILLAYVSMLVTTVDRIRLMAKCNDTRPHNYF
uniref:EH domain-containing protein 1 n=1 Tax=Tanacetum cinerariifolium TaxID=118510 RepID=A0A699KHG3_TANCI|nr:EH domain-containing protein 1 [Tanacetum cinerariifolium]